MIVRKTFLEKNWLFFFSLVFLLREKSTSAQSNKSLNSTCNNEKFLCKPFDSCEAYKIRTRLSNELVWCDSGNHIVCCPQEILLETTSKYYRDISKPYTEDCKEWNEQFYPECYPKKLIVGDRNATAKEFPHMALLGTRFRNEYMWSCGGSLISPRYVLTAAHCMEQEKTPTHVRLGELDYNSTDDATLIQDFEIKDYKTHPDYEPERDLFYYDIAIIELDGIAQLSRYVLPICLPVSNGSENERLYTAGWGSLGYARDSSTYLQKVVLERFDEKTCQNVIGEPFSDGEGVQPDYQLCAGSFNDNRDTCQGDSGGPLFVQHPDLPCMYVIHGITSYGNACGVKNIPGVYTRVYPYVSWIESIVWNTNK